MHCYKIVIEIVGFPWMTCTWVLKVVSVRCQWWVHWVCFWRRVMDERLPLFSRWSADKYRHAEEDGGPEGREIAARDEENFQAPDVTSATTTPKGPVGHGNFPCLHPNSTPLLHSGTSSSTGLELTLLGQELLPVSLTLFWTFNSLFINLFLPVFHFWYTCL